MTLQDYPPGSLEALLQSYTNGVNKPDLPDAGKLVTAEYFGDTKGMNFSFKTVAEVLGSYDNAGSLAWSAWEKIPNPTGIAQQLNYQLPAGALRLAASMRWYAHTPNGLRYTEHNFLIIDGAIAMSVTGATPLYLEWPNGSNYFTPTYSLQSGMVLRVQIANTSAQALFATGGSVRHLVFS
jgi:hypothetical protein